MSTPESRTDTPVTSGGGRMVGDVMHPALTTVELDSHLAGAAYQMRHAGQSALVVIDDLASNAPVAIVTETDIVDAVADGKDLDQTRLRSVVRPALTTIGRTATVDAAAEIMLGGGFRHLPVVDNGSLVGMIDLVDVCRVLTGA
jgi:CBS domain-containing protein